MRAKAETISTVLADYENNSMTPEHILDWVEQFDGGDQDFILEELLHIFKKTYLSRSKCKEFLISYIEYWTKEFKYSDVSFFVAETAFLDLQPTHKSQKELLNLMDEILVESYNCNLAKSGKKVKRYIYVDDVLSTGGTIFRDLDEWLKSTNDIDTAKNNFQFITNTKIKVSVCLLCLHKWGLNNTEYRLMQSLDISVKKYIDWYWFYAIENNIKDFNPSLNHMLPINNGNVVINNYINNLTSTANIDRAFRSPSNPTNEKLFSSAISRNRLETLFLVKGIEILSRVGKLRVEQIRPLGYTVKSHKTFGLGTLFFTYRNIPNNCPIVFWWASNNWKPLFVLKNRGI